MLDADWLFDCRRESKLTQLLKECLGSSTSRVCMVAHVSPATHAYNETLQVLQLASRIQRLRTRRKTSKVASLAESPSTSDNTDL